MGKVKAMLMDWQEQATEEELALPFEEQMRLADEWMLDKLIHQEEQRIEDGQNRWAETGSSRRR